MALVGPTHLVLLLPSLLFGLVARSDHADLGVPENLEDRAVQDCPWDLDLREFLREALGSLGDPADLRDQENLGHPVGLGLHGHQAVLVILWVLGPLDLLGPPLKLRFCFLLEDPVVQVVLVVLWSLLGHPVSLSFLEGLGSQEVPCVQGPPYHRLVQGNPLYHSSL